MAQKKMLPPLNNMPSSTGSPSGTASAPASAKTSAASASAAARKQTSESYNGPMRSETPTGRPGYKRSSTSPRLTFADERVSPGVEPPVVEPGMGGSRLTRQVSQARSVDDDHAKGHETVQNAIDPKAGQTSGGPLTRSASDSALETLAAEVEAEGGGLGCTIS